MNKSKRGITLIALVITIIVLLILAGISISMLSGDNTILNQALNAKTNTTHGNVLEKLRLDVTGDIIDKVTENTSNGIIEFLQSKQIIGNEIEDENNEGTGKWQIDVEKLLGSKQAIGNGTNFKDTYILEEKEENGKKSYEVNYYENDESTKRTIGMLYDEIINKTEKDTFNLRYEYGYLWADCNDWKKNIDEKNETTLINIFENFLKIMEKEYKNMGATDEQIENEINPYRTYFQNGNINEKKDIITELISNMSITSCLYNDTESIKQNKGHEFSWKVEKPGKYTVNYLNLEKSSENTQKSTNINTLDDYIIDRIVFQVYSGEIYIDVLYFNNGSYEKITPDKIIMKINNEEVVNGSEIVGENGDRVYTISKDFDEKYTTYEGEIIAFIGERQVTYNGPIYVSGGE